MPDTYFSEKALRMARHHLTQLQEAIYDTRPEHELLGFIDAPLLLALVWREVRWSDTPAYRDRGPSKTPLNPLDNTGDAGHGHGIFQIDDRWHKDFIATGGAYYPYEAAKYVIVHVLAANYRVLHKNLPALPHPWLIRATVASYNCGAGNVRQALAGIDWTVIESWALWKRIDSRTANANYSQDVMSALPLWEKWYKEQLL